MAFLQSFPQSEFGSLFRLLDDYDSHRSTRGASTGHRPSLRTIQPRFDVHEEGDAYHLNGELPGANQDDIDITFTDPQTMVVRGRVERAYGNGPAEKAAEKAKQPTVEDEEPSDAVAKADEPKQAKPRFWVSERSVGEFSRTFSFPAPVDQEAVKANFKNGILGVTVPKAQPPAARKIQIEA